MNEQLQGLQSEMKNMITHKRAKISEINGHNWIYRDFSCDICTKLKYTYSLKCDKKEKSK